MTKCIKGSAYGDTCEHSSPCKLNLGADGRCLDHLCVCRSTHYPKRVANEVAKDENDDLDAVNNLERITCAPIVPFGALCRNDSECRMQPMDQENATAPIGHPMVCNWGECSCSKTHRLEDNKCVFVENSATNYQLRGFVAFLCIQFTMILY